MRAWESHAQSDEPGHRRRRWAGLTCNRAGVGHLSARFEIERRLRQRDVAVGARRERCHGAPLGVKESEDLRSRNAGRRVALELIAVSLQAVVRAELEVFGLLPAEGALRARLVP